MCHSGFVARSPIVAPCLSAWVCQGQTNELLGSLRLGSLRLVLVKAQIFKLVNFNELKVKFGSAHYALTSAHERSLRIVKEKMQEKF
jgi:hypothetical protein